MFSGNFVLARARFNYFCGILYETDSFDQTTPVNWSSLHHCGAIYWSAFEQIHSRGVPVHMSSDKIILCNVLELNISFPQNTPVNWSILRMLWDLSVGGVWR